MKRGIAELILGGGLCGCALKPPEALPSHRASLALMNVRVIDGSGGPLTTNAVTNEVTGRRITAIYDSKLRHPRADSIIDLEGKVIIPGLFDSHVHLTIAGRMASRLQLQRASPWLRAVTDSSDVRRIVAEARRANMRVWSHSAIFPASPFDVVAASVHSTSHATDDVWAAGDDLPHMSKGTLNLSDFSNDPAKSPRVDSLLRLMRTNGTVLDATLSVLNVRVKYGGLTPLEAIASAIFNAAQLLGVEEDYGTVTVGKVADLLVLDADPSIDIRNTRRPRMVLKGGTLLFRRTVG